MKKTLLSFMSMFMLTLFAIAQNQLPEAGKQYYLGLTTTDGTFYLSMKDGIRIQEEGTPVSFVAQEDGTYAITNGEEYVNYAGNNNWTMSASTTAYGWTLNEVEGGITIQGKNGLLGTNTSDGAGVGSPCYGDKKTNNGFVTWTLTPCAKPADSYTGIIEQNLYAQGAIMGTSVSEQTVSIEKVADGLVNVTFSGFTFPMLPFTVPEFTIENVAATVNGNETTYSAGNFQVAVPMGMMQAFYNGTLIGMATDNGIPAFHLTIQNATTNEVYFGADQKAIDGLKVWETPKEQISLGDPTMNLGGAKFYNTDITNGCKACISFENACQITNSVFLAKAIAEGKVTYDIAYTLYDITGETVTGVTDTKTVMCNAIEINLDREVQKGKVYILKINNVTVTNQETEEVILTKEVTDEHYSMIFATCPEEQAKAMLAAYYAGDATAIQNAAAANSSISEIHSVNGARQNTLKAGVNVVKLANGKVVKIMK